MADGALYEKDSEKIRNHLLSGIKEVTRNSSAKVKFGKYRGFDIFIKRVSGLASQDGFRLILKGESEKEYSPANFAYTFEDKLSLSGMFTRIDNFLAKGFDEEISAQRERAHQEKAKVDTIYAALGKEFPQKVELDLVRENHAAVIRELQRMQEDDGYVSEWQPKKLEKIETETQGTTERIQGVPQKLIYGTPEKRTEYTVSTQHNGYEMEGHVLRRTYFDNQVGSIGQSFYSDGQWHTTANVPSGVQIMRFQNIEAAVKTAKDDAAVLGLREFTQLNIQEFQQTQVDQAKIFNRAMMRY